MTPRLSSAEATRRAQQQAEELMHREFCGPKCIFPNGCKRKIHGKVNGNKIAKAYDLAVLSARVEQMQWVLDQSPRYHDEELIEERDRLRREMEGKG